MLYVPSMMSSAGSGGGTSADDDQAPVTHNHLISNSHSKAKCLDPAVELNSMSPRARLDFLQHKTQSCMDVQHLRHRPVVNQLKSLPDGTSEKINPEPTPWILRRSVRFSKTSGSQNPETRLRRSNEEPSLSTTKEEGPHSSDSDSLSELAPARIATSPPPPLLETEQQLETRLHRSNTIPTSDRLLLKRSSSRRVLRKRPVLSLKRAASLRFNNKSLFSADVRAEGSDGYSLSSALSFRPELGPDENSDCEACHRVTLNVSGMRFETWLDILSQHPTTLLGNPAKREKHYDPRTSEYFFDRHRPSFEAIFNYYQYGGKLKRPLHVPDEIFLDELRFYEIEPEVVALYKRSEGYVHEAVVLPENKYKCIVWKLFELPETSLLAFLISVTSVLFTVTSTVAFCVETLARFQQNHCTADKKPNYFDPFFITETICTFWFQLEVLARFFSCPSKRAYLKDFQNCVDVAAIVPYYLTLGQVLTSQSCEGAKNSSSLAFLRVIRLVRVFKLTKHSAGLQVLLLTFRASLKGLTLFLAALVVCILLFSSSIYYAEIGEKCSQISSIPDAFWWAVITMCTVGYGDKVPQGHLGKLIGSICAVAGVLTLAIPVPIITENFNKFYAHKTGRGRH